MGSDKSPWGDPALLDTLLRKKDFYAGGLMVLLGAAVTLNSTSYTLGTLMHMGPGMFPFILVFVSALGDRTATLKSSFLLAAGVTFFGVLLFSNVLQIPFPMFRWGR